MVVNNLCFSMQRKKQTKHHLQIPSTNPRKTSYFWGGLVWGVALWQRPRISHLQFVPQTGLFSPSPLVADKSWKSRGWFGVASFITQNPKMTWNTTYKHSKWWFWKLGAWKNPGGYWLGSRGVHAAGLTGVSSTKKELSRTSIKSSRSRILESWWLNDQLHKLTLR